MEDERGRIGVLGSAIMGKKIQSDFLFARPSFISGMASAIDLWGDLPDYNDSATTSEADAAAIAADWMMVGQDLTDALDACALEDRAA